MEVIYSYTDQDAVTDGVLVPVNAKDRVTRAVWDFISARVASNRPPLRWPLSGSVKAMYPLDTDADWRTCALCVGLLEHYSEPARLLYDNDTLWHAKLEATATTLDSISPGSKEALQVWILPNELGGLTLMFPEDY